MSLGAKIAVSAMRGIKKTSLIKGPSADLDAELRKAKKYNRKHPYARLCESQNRGVKAVRILIFGAGVIGSLYGALLAEAGYEVSVYARGRRLESMSQDGLLVKYKGNIRKARAKVLSRLEAEDRYEHVFFLTVRENQQHAAPDEIR